MMQQMQQHNLQQQQFAIMMLSAKTMKDMSEHKFESIVRQDLNKINSLVMLKLYKVKFRLATNKLNRFISDKSGVLSKSEFDKIVNRTKQMIADKESQLKKKAKNESYMIESLFDEFDEFDI